MGMLDFEDLEDFVSCSGQIPVGLGARLAPRAPEALGHPAGTKALHYITL